MKKMIANWTSLLMLAFIVGISGCGGGSGSGSGSGSGDNDSPTMPTASGDNDSPTMPTASGDNDSPTMPTASAGSDITVNKYTSVALDASLSSDTTSYKWTQTEGPTVNLSDDESASPEFTPNSAATYRFTLEASNANGSDSDEVVIVAQDISTVSITSPTSDEAIATTQSSLTLSGSAGQYIASVTLSNNTTGSTYDGSLDGNGSFSTDNIVLQSGDNLLEVVGTDNTGAITKDTLLVTYNQSVNFLSSPAFSEDSGFINENTETVVSIAIEENQNIVFDGVKLTELDSNGSIVSSDVATLYDDGNVANGDDIAGDGVYSSKLTLNKSEAGSYNYRVAVNTGVTEYSSPIYFTVLTPLTDQDIQSADDATEAAFTNNFPAVGSHFTQSEFDIYKDEILAELSLLSDVANAQLAADGNSIVIEFNSGLIHTIDFIYKVDGTDYFTQGGSSRHDGSQAPTQGAVQAKLKYNHALHSIDALSYSSKALSAAINTQSSSAISEDNSIGSYRAMAVSPFYWQFDPWDANNAYSIIENSETPTFTAETKLVDYEVSVENFKNLSNYGVVLINSHGGLEGTQSVIYTGEEATANKQKFYQKDIDAKRLMVSHKITILVEDGGFLWFDSKEQREVFKIAPSFITKYNSDMPNTLVYIGICNGITTDTLANAFLSAGAGAVVGFTDIVYTGYNYAVTETLFEEMISGKTVEEAVDSATSAHGSDDSQWANANNINDDGTPAAFVYRGNGDLVLERTGIQNGGFEDNLKYWEQNVGDIRILSKLSSVSPQEGSYMAILSSGLGSVSDSEAIITQQFKVPADADFLTFNYDVVSEEPMEYVGSLYDDKFRAVLIDEDGNEIELAYETVNTSSWTAISGSQSDGGMFDGGDETAFHTGWKSKNHQITSLAGQTVTLKFRVWDVGDSIYDTAALIDNISLQ